MGVVVDSSIFIATQKRRFDWAAWIDSLGSSELLISSITLSELLHGAHRAASVDQASKRIRFVARLESDYCIVPFACGKRTPTLGFMRICIPVAT